MASPAFILLDIIPDHAYVTHNKLRLGLRSCHISDPTLGPEWVSADGVFYDRKFRDKRLLFKCMTAQTRESLSFK